MVTALIALVHILAKAKLSFSVLWWKRAVNPTGCDHCGLWRRVALSFSKGCRHTVQTQQLQYTFWLRRSYVRETTCLGTGSYLFSSLHGTSTLPCLTQWQSVVVNGSIQYSKSLNSSLVGLNVIVQALHTNTSSVRSCLLQHLFIDCLMTLYDWIGIADTQTEQNRRIFSKMKRRRVFEQRNIFLSAFTFHESYLHPTYLGSQSQLWAFFDLKKCR